MQLDLTHEETLALLNLLTEAIEADRYPLSPRIRRSAASWRSSGRWDRRHLRQPDRRRRRRATREGGPVRDGVRGDHAIGVRFGILENR